MMGKSHLALGGLAGAAAATAVGVDPATVLLLIPVGMAGGLAPDLDHPNSKLGKLLPRWFHRRTPGHRGCTHSLLWALLAGLTVAVATALVTRDAGVAALTGLTFTAGVLSHLAADGITLQGVPWLWPWRKDRIVLPLAIRTGGIGEQVIVGAVMGVGGLLLLAAS